MDDELGSVPMGFLENRSRKAIVDDKQEIVTFAKLPTIFQIDNFQSGITRGFHDHQLGLFPDSIRPFYCMFRIYVGGSNSQTGKDLMQDLMRGTKKGARRQDVITRTEKAYQFQVHRRYPGRSSKSRRFFLQEAHFADKFVQ